MDGSTVQAAQSSPVAQYENIRLADTWSLVKLYINISISVPTGVGGSAS